jgi:hypothetical protein
MSQKTQILLVVGGTIALAFLPLGLQLFILVMGLLITPIVFVVGLIKPAWIKLKSRWQVVKISSLMFLFFFFGTGLAGSRLPKQPQVIASPQPSVSPSIALALPSNIAPSTTPAITPSRSPSSPTPSPKPPTQVSSSSPSPKPPTQVSSSSPSPTPPTQISSPSPSPVKKGRVQIRAATQGQGCTCPYDTDRAGRQCGARSAYSKAGGNGPSCYENDS